MQNKNNKQVYYSLLKRLLLHSSICYALKNRKKSTRLIFVYLFISDFAMSTEIKDNEDITSNKEVNKGNHEQSQEIEQLSPSENEQSEEKIEKISIDEKQKTEPPSENGQLEEKIEKISVDEKQETEPPTENEQLEEKISVDEKQETEPPVLTSNEHEIPLEPPSTDVIIEKKEEEPISAIITEENISTLPGSQEDNTPVNTVQSELTSRTDDTHQFLQIIADKSNKEASAAILNTVRSYISLYFN